MITIANIEENKNKFINNLDNCVKYENYVNKVITLFVRGGMSFDYSIDAPACVEMTGDFHIMINPRKVAEMIADSLEFTEDEVNEWPRKDRYEGRESDLYYYFLCAKAQERVAPTVLYLALHEIAHALYSAPYSTSKACREAFAKNIPAQLVALIENIVEDVYIQTEFLRNYPAVRYREAMLQGQSRFQGGKTLENYKEQVQTSEQIAVYSKLYYFILRGYNPENADIKNLFGAKEKMGWSEETICLFDKAQFISNKEKRCRFVSEELAPSVYKDLLDSSMEEMEAMMNAEGEGEEGDGEEGEEGQEGQGSSKGRGKGRGKSSGNPEAGEGDGDADEDAEGQDGQSGKSNGGKGHGNGQGEGKDGEGTAAAAQKAIDEQIKKAAEELLKKIGENRKRADASSAVKKETAKNREDRILKGCGVKTSELSSADMQLSNLAQNLYDNFSENLCKLHNLENTEITRLDQGELDENLITEFYSERNLEIFKERNDVVQNRDIAVTFILDRSGSMGGDQYGRLAVSSSIIAAACHAFDDVGIKTSVFVFDDESVRIKEFDENAVLNGYSSNIYNKIISMGCGGSTNPTGAFEALVSDPQYTNLDEDTGKILFFLTDGSMDCGRGGQVESRIQQVIGDLTDNGWFVMPIGIDFGDNELQNLQRFTAPAKAMAFNSSTLTQTLGEVIYNTIVDNFILV